ncbi:hypothetical protein [Streptomyces sp. NPDC018055]|uniref:hypothetical protein n=1 Tax=Streptomyces sp. NPDC018055 TaxID=3365038 RepID=UPI0037B6E4BC
MQTAYLSLTNGIPIESRLFDTECAEEFEGDTTLPGMRKPGTEWEVGMYLTRDGAWVLNTLIVRKQDVINVFKEVEGDRAHAWLKQYHHLEAAERYFERPKGGRPKIGERLITTVPARVQHEIADLAEMYAEPMPDTVRRLLGEALEHRRIIGAPGSRQER